MLEWCRAFVCRRIGHVWLETTLPWRIATQPTRSSGKAAGAHQQKKKKGGTERGRRRPGKRQDGVQLLPCSWLERPTKELKSRQLRHPRGLTAGTNVTLTRPFGSFFSSCVLPGAGGEGEGRTRPTAALTTLGSSNDGNHVSCSCPPLMSPDGHASPPAKNLIVPDNDTPFSLSFSLSLPSPSTPPSHNLLSAPTSRDLPTTARYQYSYLATAVRMYLVWLFQVRGRRLCGKEG